MAIQFRQDGTYLNTSTGEKVETPDDDQSEYTENPYSSMVITPNAPPNAIQLSRVESKKPTQKPEKVDISGFNVIRLAKARKRLLLREVKRLRECEKELAQLERLLTAAEKPMAVVHELSNKRITK